MKKITIMLSVIFMLMCSLFTVDAKENATDNNDTINQSITADNLTNLEEAKKLICDYIEKENLTSSVNISEVCYDTEGNEYYFINIKTYEWEIDEIKNFISESNIDENMINFYVVDTAIVKPSTIIGDSNKDGFLNVRDCAFIASALANGTADDLTEISDFNSDGKINVRDAAAIATHLASK